MVPGKTPGPETTDPWEFVSLFRVTCQPDAGAGPAAAEPATARVMPWPHIVLILLPRLHHGSNLAFSVTSRHGLA